MYRCSSTVYAAAFTHTDKVRSGFFFPCFASPITTAVCCLLPSTQRLQACDASCAHAIRQMPTAKSVTVSDAHSLSVPQVLAKQVMGRPFTTFTTVRLDLAQRAGRLLTNYSHVSWRFRFRIQPQNMLPDVCPVSST